MAGSMKRRRTRWGSVRIAVSAKWPEIATALKAEWPLTMIFEKHMPRAEISYSQFRRQVHRFQAMDKEALQAAVDHKAVPTIVEGSSDASSSPDSFGKDYDSSINPDRLHRLIGKPKQ